MLGGMAISSLTLFTACTASPNDAFGARLKERVTTGNWPWWLIVIGTAVVSMCAKVLRGTWPLFGYAEEEAMPAPLNALPEGPGDKLFRDAPGEAPPAADDALVGPVESPAVVPPETSPEAAAAVAAPVRTNRLRRSEGSF